MVCKFLPRLTSLKGTDVLFSIGGFPRDSLICRRVSDKMYSDHYLTISLIIHGSHIYLEAPSLILLTSVAEKNLLSVGIF